VSPSAEKVYAVVPAWDEATSLGPLLAELFALPTGTLAGVIVVDAGSTDGTPAVARALGAAVVAQSRRGYGAACHEGFLAAAAAGATHVVFLDGDGSDPPGAVPALLQPLVRGIADLVLAVRCAPPGQPSSIPWHARLGNALVRFLLRLRAGRTVRDLPSMKALSTCTLQSLGLSQMGYGWTTELIARSLHRRLRVHELTVHTRPRLAGHSKVSGHPLNSAHAAYALLRTALRATP
jgi:glycosyltransferase involved in cell wall biosynthesis